MKVSKDSVVPQLELGPRLGGLKQMYMRSGVVTRPVTMVSAMTAAYSTTPYMKALFGSFAAFVAFVALCIAAYMAFDFMVLYPSEQSFNQEQAQRAERSPLKRDTEEIKQRLDELGD